MAPRLIANLFLFSAAIVWGGGFVAQRLGAESLGPFWFGGLRFALGAIALLPFLLRSGEITKTKLGSAVVPVLLTGFALFAAASLQQIGIESTTAGKAGFLTSVYIVLVPILAIFFRRRISRMHWVSALLALAGTYLLSAEKFGGGLSEGDLWVLLGAVAWAVHILVIDRFTKQLDPIVLSVGQFAVCGALSLTVGALFESIDWASIRAGAGAILYGGLVSVGVGYTFQVVGQKNAHPVHAALILSLEAVFALIFGLVFLGETTSLLQLVGCAVLLGAVALSSCSDVVRYSEKV